MNGKWVRIVVITLFTAALVTAFAFPAFATLENDLIGGGAGTQDPNIQVNLNGGGSDAVNLLLLMTVLSLLPSIVVMMTSFTRIIITFSLLRNATGLQQTPPNQVLIGIALFLTLFIMHPVITEINETAYQPFSESEITSQEFIARASVPLKDFMLRQTRADDINLMWELSPDEPSADPTDFPMTVVIPAFILSEIKRAFTIGFLIYIPFMIIDMVVGSALMSMGMMMLPPAMISMPFKLMLFVLVDGWGLLVRALVQSYHIQ